jgi:hypothetical protein
VSSTLDISNLIYDTWAPLSYKSTVATSRATSAMTPTWVGTANQRRLAALCVLRAYIDNIARLHIAAITSIGQLPPSTNPDLATIIQSAEDPRKNHREYGDPAVLVATAVDRLLGEDVAIVVPDAADEPPDAPEVSPEPEDPGPDAGPVERRLYEVTHARWETEANQTIDEWESEVADHDAAVERQRWLREEWAGPEQFVAKLYEAEFDAVGLGDGVYALGWSNTKRRPRVTVYDPGFYFPVLDDGADDDYPRRVHIAWEYEDFDGDRYVRRITWSLGPIGGQVDAVGEPVIDAEGLPLVLDGDILDDDGNPSRVYPWHAGSDEPSNLTCYMTDAVWQLADVNAHNPDELDPGKAIYQVNEDGQVIRDLDLRIDFIPVVHVPNTPASKEHWGRSILLSVAQLLDDIQATDTDLSAAAATTGVPPIVLKGTKKTGGVLSVRPGEVWETGENGGLDVLDTSKSLVALSTHRKDLLDRLSVNSRVPAEILGRVQASQVPSGITLVIAFGPLRSLVRVMRLTRIEKYPLVLKFVQRLAQVGGVLPAGPVPRAEVAFGSFIPNDKTVLITDVRALFEGKIISRQTALEILVEAAVISVDITDEMSRVEAEDFAAAFQLLEATGDEPAVRRRLHLQGEGPRPAVPPEDLRPVKQHFQEPGAPTLPGEPGVAGGTQPGDPGAPQPQPPAPPAAPAQ